MSLHSHVQLEWPKTQRFVMDSKGRRCWMPRRSESNHPRPGDNCLSRMPGANYGNRWSLAIDLWQAPIQTLTGCAPSRSSSLRPDTLNPTLGIPVVVYLDWGPALVSLFLEFSTMTLAWRAADVRLRHQWGPGVADHTWFKTQANLGLTLNFHHDDCESVTTHGVNGIRWCLDI